MPSTHKNPLHWAALALFIHNACPHRGREDVVVVDEVEFAAGDAVMVEIHA